MLRDDTDISKLEIVAFAMIDFDHDGNLFVEYDVYNQELWDKHPREIQDSQRCDCCNHSLKYVCICFNHQTQTFHPIGRSCASSIDVHKHNAIEGATLRFQEIRACDKRERKWLEANPQYTDLINRCKESNISFVRNVYQKLRSKGKLSVRQLECLQDVLDNQNDWVYKNESLIKEMKCSKNAFVQDLLNQIEKRGSLSPNQVSAVYNALDREKAEAETIAEDCPNSRCEIIGVIISFKEHETAFGTSRKMLVRDDRGFKVYGSSIEYSHLCDLYNIDDSNVASSMSIRIGDRVSFKATITRSDKDSKFGFFKRPKFTAFQQRIV